MNKIDLIKLMIDYISEYKSESDLDDKIVLNDFKDWLMVKFTEAEFDSKDRDVDGKNFEMLAILQQYLGKYLRASLKETNISTVWDFIFLAILSHQGDKGMIDLINISRMEKSSGMEVVKRLQKLDYIKSIDDKKDKRKKLQRITSLGHEKLQELYPIVDKLSKKVNGDLTAKEKSMLFYLLNKLDIYHQKELGYSENT